MKKCQELGITILADLLHFGLPDWLHADNPTKPYFQNSDVPQYFAQYVREFTLYPHITYFTPVNEPNVTAILSVKVGYWNEQLKSDWRNDKEYLRAAVNISKAAVLAREEIEKVWKEEHREGEPIFVQNESFERTVAEEGSGREEEAYHVTRCRFVCLDLIFGYIDMHDYLVDQGIFDDEYEWFMENGKITNTLLGFDYYDWCHQLLKANDEFFPLVPFLPEKFINYPYPMDELVIKFWDRYQIPLLHTETNAWPEVAIEKCTLVYNILSQLRKNGYPILGMSWFGDELQVGWQWILSGPYAFDETPVGLFYKGRKQPVADLVMKYTQQGLALLIDDLECNNDLY